MKEDALLIQESLSQQPEISNWIFCIFLIMLVLFGSIGRKIGLFQSIAGEIFAVKERKNTFYGSTMDEWYGKLLLCLQTCILLSIFLYKVSTNNSNIILNTPIGALIFIGITTLILCIFLFAKWAAYYLVGIVFYNKSAVKIWITNFFSIIAFSGVILFIPVLLYFYVDFVDEFCFAFVAIYLLLLIVFITYKSFVLFFHKPSDLLNLFLYLCAQEIIPLFLLWKTLVIIMFNFAGK